MHYHRLAACLRFFFIISVFLLAAVVFSRSSWAAKNVIIMISDGGGYNTWAAASMYQGKLGGQVYDRPGWLRISCATYPLNQTNSPSGDDKQDEKLVYNPKKAWDVETDPAKPGLIPGYEFLVSTPTDSAAAATALASGRKTYNNAINWSNENKSLNGQTVAEIAKAQGKAVGVISSVQLSHATPAGLGGAHNVSRNNYAQIANEMLDGGWLDVIMGCGNPDFDHDGQPLPEDAKRNYNYVGGRETWEALKQGRREWKLVESKADFAALADGPTPAKVLGVPQVAETLQLRRKASLTKLAYDKVKAALSPEQQQKLPYTTPLNENVPSLAAMAKAALNCLDDDPDGLYLMIEGGAVDWANHANEADRMIEEQMDFVEAVEAVVEWIESHGGWGETLLILTADHETGLIWGPDSDKIAFQPIEDRGAGKLPGMKYHSHGHSNSLVPLYARGAGSSRFLELASEFDAEIAARWHNSGLYVQNADVAEVAKAELTAPERCDWCEPCDAKPCKKRPLKFRRRFILQNICK